MLRNYNFYRVLSVFLENPTRGFGWRELSGKARLGPPSTKKYLEEMKKEGIVLQKKIAGRLLYFADRESRKYRLYKVFDLLLRLEDSGVIDRINEIYAHPAIVLFGSHATGEAVEDSDIDLAVMTESKKDIKIENLEKFLKNEVHIFKFGKSGFKALRKQNPSLYNGVINGVVISGRMDVA